MRQQRIMYHLLPFRVSGRHTGCLFPGQDQSKANLPVLAYFIADYCAAEPHDFRKLIQYDLFTMYK